MPNQLLKNRITIKEWTIWIALFIVPLFFYPWAIFSTWISNSDVHALLGFWAAFTALVAAGTVLVHFFENGQRFFLLISIGFTLQCAGDFVCALFSFNRLWTEKQIGLDNFLTGTYVTGRLILVLCLILALFMRKSVSPKKNRKKELIQCNAVGFFILAIAAMIIVNSNIQRFIFPGYIISRPVDFIVALIYLVTFFFYIHVYKEEEQHSPFMWFMIGSIIFGFITHVYMIHSQRSYDAQFDISHIMKIFSYIFPIFGIAVSTFAMYKNKEALVEALSDLLERERRKAAKAAVAEIEWQKATELSQALYNAEKNRQETEKALAEAKEAEELLHESQIELSTIYDNAPVIMILVDNDRCIRKVNRAAVEFAGHTADEMMNICECFALGCIYSIDVSKKCGYSPFCETCTLRNLTIDTFNTGKSHYRVEGRLIFIHSEKQKECILLISTTALSVLDKRMVLVCLEDITERKMMEVAIRGSEEKYKLLTEGLKDVVLRVSSAGRLEYCSPVIKEFAGYLPEEEVGNFIFKYFANKKELMHALEVIKQISVDKNPASIEFLFKPKDSEAFYVEVTGNPIIKGDKVEIIQCVMRDITARKKAEAERIRLEKELQQAQKLESIGTLAAGIAHEINTPIQFIGDNVRFLSDVINNLLKLIGRYKEHILKSNPEEKIMSEIDQDVDLAYLEGEIPGAIAQTEEGLARVTKIVNAMKDFSHIGTGEKTPIDINKALESTITVCRNAWKYVADLKTDYDPTLPSVSCFAHDINQTVMNLIINASHTIADVIGDGSHGKGLITITTRKKDDVVIISVSDTGAGIPENVRDKIFDPFFTTKEVGKGTGQGLSLAYSTVVEKHDGKLTFETEVGKGSTFIIELPLK